MRHPAALLVLIVPLALFACGSELEPTQYGGPGSLAGTASPSKSFEPTCTTGRYVTDGGACSVSWTKDVFPKIQGAWNCTTCHKAGGDPPEIPNEPAGAYAALVAKTLNGKPYVNPCSTDIAASSFACNTRSGPDGKECGKVMPNAGGIPQADRAMVATWIQCGAPNSP